MFRIKIIILFALILSACEEYGVIKVYGTKEQYAFKNAAIRNFINIVTPYNEVKGTMKYFTGGAAGGSDYTEKVPTKEVSRFVKDNISIITYSNVDYSDEIFESLSTNIVNTIYEGTETIWPKAERPLIIEYFVMGQDEAYTFAKKVKWNEGEPLQLAVFQKEGNEDASTVLHEYYHLLTDIYKVGQSDPKYQELYNYYDTYEELAGDLFAYCGELLAVKEFSFDFSVTGSINFGKEVYKTPLESKEVKELLGLISDNKFPGIRRNVLTYTIMSKVLNRKDNISVDSKEGQELLSLCKMSAGNPTYLEEWFNQNYY